MEAQNMVRLEDVLEQRKGYYLAELKKLIAIDTHDIGHGIGGGREKAGQDYLMELLASMGASHIQVDPLREDTIRECLEQYQEGNPGHDQTDRFNVYATFQGKPGGKSLLFNGHMDVMPAEEADGWTYPPYQPTVTDGRLYGRGTADMKAGLMASVMAVQLLKDAGQPLPGDVIITSVCDEEGGGNGSIQAVMSGLKADGVVNCEPSGDELILAHMGWLFFRVEFQGKACHSGGKINGVSAIDKAIKVIQALNEKEHEWLLRYKHPLLPAPNLNIGVIRGGEAGSTVPGDCLFETCIHFVPGQMSHDQVAAEFTDVVDRVAQADPWLKEHPPKLTMYQAGNGFEMDREHAFISAFEKAYRKCRGKDVTVVGSPSGCDSRLWHNIAGCPTLQFGPGNLAQCHAVDEWVDLEAYYEAILIYARLISEWC